MNNLTCFGSRNPTGSNISDVPHDSKRKISKETAPAQPLQPTAEATAAATTGRPPAGPLGALQRQESSVEFSEYAPRPRLPSEPPLAELQAAVTKKGAEKPDHHNGDAASDISDSVSFSFDDESSDSDESSSSTSSTTSTTSSSSSSQSSKKEKKKTKEGRRRKTSQPHRHSSAAERRRSLGERDPFAEVEFDEEIEVVDEGIIVDR